MYKKLSSTNSLFDISPQTVNLIDNGLNNYNGGYLPDTENDEPYEQTNTCNRQRKKEYTDNILLKNNIVSLFENNKAMETQNLSLGCLCLNNNINNNFNKLSTFSWLRTINLKNNNLSEINFNIFPDNIETIDFSNNHIQKIRIIKKFNNLRNLFFKNNKLCDTLSINKLTTPNLTNLDVSNNLLQGELHNCVFLGDITSNLTFLNVSNNNLSSIEYIDNNLEQLVCRYNELRKIVIMSNKLKIIDISHNQHIEKIVMHTNELINFTCNGTLNFLESKNIKIILQKTCRFSVFPINSKILGHNAAGIGYLDPTKMVESLANGTTKNINNQDLPTPKSLDDFKQNKINITPQKVVINETVHTINPGVKQNSYANTIINSSHYHAANNSHEYYNNHHSNTKNDVWNTKNNVWNTRNNYYDNYLKKKKEEEEEDVKFYIEKTIKDHFKCIERITTVKFKNLMDSTYVYLNETKTV